MEQRLPALTQIFGSIIRRQCGALPWEMAEVVELQVCDIYGAKIVENGIDKQVEVGKLRVNDICIFFTRSYNSLFEVPLVMAHVNRRK